MPWFGCEVVEAVAVESVGDLLTVAGGGLSGPSFAVGAGEAGAGAGEVDGEAGFVL